LTLRRAPAYLEGARRVAALREDLLTEQAAVRSPITRISVRLRIGDSLLAASDDPLFLGISGGSGREFRLQLARGSALRRGSEDRFVLGAPDDPATNVAHPAFNDPTSPPLDAESVEGLYLRKGLEPIPNVRGLGEMDDRLEILEAEVEIHVRDRSEPIRYARQGPIWLGLVAGLRFEVPRVPERE
jgi:hypothetical protein